MKCENCNREIPMYPCDGCISDRDAWTSERVAYVKAKIAEMDRDTLVKYFTTVAVQIVLECANEHGSVATDWPINLHLSDVLEKRLMRYYKNRVEELEDADPY